jgi:hypothetical protein
MNRVFAVMLIATACVVGSTPTFALGGVVHLLARGEAEHGLDSGTMRNPTTRFGAAPPTGLVRKPHYGATRGTGHKRAGGAEPIWRRHVNVLAANRSMTGKVAARPRTRGNRTAELSRDVLARLVQDRATLQDWATL